MCIAVIDNVLVTQDSHDKGEGLSGYDKKASSIRKGQTNLQKHNVKQSK